MATMTKEFEALKKQVKEHGVAFVAAKLGFRDTGRVKNWLIRKKIPKEFTAVVSSTFKQ
jgi:hypothetical protein